MQMTYEQHATQAKTNAKAAGCADCIHYATDWRRRVDALYAVANASGLAWWSNGGGNPYLIADGRMVIVCNGFWFFEAR